MSLISVSLFIHSNFTFSDFKRSLTISCDEETRGILHNDMSTIRHLSRKMKEEFNYNQEIVDSIETIVHEE
jgi:hypothetical protein